MASAAAFLTMPSARIIGRGKCSRADLEVLERALRLRAPVAVGGDLDLAHAVGFGASWVWCQNDIATRLLCQSADVRRSAQLVPPKRGARPAGARSGLQAPTTARSSRSMAATCQDAALVERYKRLSIPVRRALNPTDRAVVRAGARRPCEETAAGRPGGAPSRRRPPGRRLQQRTRQHGRPGRRARCRGAQILGGMARGRGVLRQARPRSRVRQLIDQWGKAAESIGAQLMEDAARVVVALDDVIAAALDEPAILPPPPKTPPPPKDPRRAVVEEAVSVGG